MNPEKVKERRRKMLSVATAISDMLRASANTGIPVIDEPRFQSLLLHFEADRVRLAGMLYGEKLDAVPRMRERLCPNGRHDWVIDPDTGGDICDRCAHKELPK